MSKAEDFAYQKYPQSKKGVLYDLARNSIIQGYHQAEKELELSWEDMKTINKLLNQCVDYSNPYQEVLKRFRRNNYGTN